MRLLVLHGASSCGAAYADLVAAAAARGLEAVAPDLPGHGARRGEPLDGRVLDELRPLAGPDVALVGHSFGGYLALRLADACDVTSVVAFAPTADELVAERFCGWDATVDAASFAAWLTEHDTYAAAAGLACPVLYVHASDDDRIPLAHVEHLHRLTPRSRLVVTGAGGHSGPPHDPACQALALDWLGSLGLPYPDPGRPRL